MKFLVDAHLPRWRDTATMQTTRWIFRRKTAQRIPSLIRSRSTSSVVISKDADFFYSHLVLGRPWKLVLVKTGNMSKDELCSLFERHLSEIAAALKRHTLVEIDRTAITPLV